MLLAIARFLDVLGILTSLKTKHDDIEKFTKLGAVALRTGDAGRKSLEAATDKMEQLIAEDRQLTDVENAEIETSIKTKLAAIAAVDLGNQPTPDPLEGSTPPSTEGTFVGRAGNPPERESADVDVTRSGP